MADIADWQGGVGRQRLPSGRSHWQRAVHSKSGYWHWWKRTTTERGWLFLPQHGL